MQQIQTSPGWSKILYRLFMAFAIISFGFIAVFYLSAPFFTYEQPQQFSGSYLYNPYADSPDVKHVKMIFELNALHLADLLINGKMKTNIKFYDTLFAAPKKLDIGNFQLMHRFLDKDNEKLLIYRHGYGLTHDQQLCFGASKVIWTEYPFFQNLRHKQDILWKLSRTSKVVGITDPLRSYTLDELRFLSGYRLIELTTTETPSLNTWDIVLSNGHRVNLLLSNLVRSMSLNLEELKIHSVHFFIDNLEADQLLECLESGSYYCLSRPESANEATEPGLLQASIQRDSLKVVSSMKASEILLIGQEGSVLNRVADTNQLRYSVNKNDTYLRVEMRFTDGSQIYLNPIVRQQDTTFQRQSPAKFDAVHTARMRGIYTVLIVLLLMLGFRFYTKKAKT